MKDKNINDQINESSKISITKNCDHSDKDNNTPSDINNNIVILALETENVVSLVVLHRNTSTIIFSQRQTKQTSKQIIAVLHMREVTFLI